MKKKSKWGGVRPGSGRKPKYADPVIRSLRLPRSLDQRIAKAAKSRGVSINAVIVELLDKYLGK